jgi:ATP-dependent Clp protease ATP-binding subunit ClpA
MFDRFSDRARKLIALANQATEHHRQSAIGTEHLLLGLLQEGQGVAMLAFADLGVDPLAIRSGVEAGIATGDHAGAGRPLPFTPQAKRALEQAASEASALHHPYIGTEHILLGLFADGDGLATRVLTGLGLHRDTARAAILAVLEGRDADPSRPPKPPTKPQPPQSPQPQQPPAKPKPPPAVLAVADWYAANAPFLTQAVTVAFVAALKETGSLGLASIRAQHLLIGLVATPGVASSALKALGVDRDRLRAALHPLVGSEPLDFPGREQFWVPCPNCGRTNFKPVLQDRCTYCLFHQDPPAETEAAKRWPFAARYAVSGRHIDTGDVLAVMLAESGAFTARVFAGLDIAHDRVVEEIRRCRREAAEVVIGDPGHGRHASDAYFRHAKEEAIGLGHEHIGAEHVQLAMLRDHPDNLTVQALLGCSIDPEAFRQRLLGLMATRRQRPDGSFAPGGGSAAGTESA